MQELWQLYDELGNPIPGKGATKDEVYKGLLHGAAHVWIWRKSETGIEVLLQKRAANKQTWPNLLDISAAGHIDLGEQPSDAAVRETQEEIGLTLDASDLELIDVLKSYMTAPDGSIENEFRWLYSIELKTDREFGIQQGEISSLVWKRLDELKAELAENNITERYVPQPDPYFEVVIKHLEEAISV